MAKLSFLPPIRSDELLYSVIARWSKYTGAMSNGAAGHDFFGRRMAVATVDLPNDLRALTDRLPDRMDLMPDDLAWHTTLFPYYAAFGEPQRVARGLEAMISGDGDVHLTLGVAAFKVRRVRTFRFCASCNHRDLLETGEIWWSRLFQLPGVLVCPIHEEPLRESSVDLDHISRHKFVAAELENCPPDAPAVCQPDARQLAQLVLIARASAGLLDRRDMSGVPLETHRQAYLERCRATGFMRSTKKVDLVALHETLRTYWAPIWPLLRQECRTDLGQDLVWLDAMLRKQRKASHPLLHILLSEFLDQQQVKEVAPSHPFGVGPWECLNPAAPHFGQPVVTAIAAYQNKGATIASFTCECGYRYTRGVDRDGSIGPPRFRTGGPLLIDRIRMLAASGISLRELARQVGLDPKTVVREMKLAGITTTSKMAAGEPRLPSPRLPKPAAMRKPRQPAKPRTDWPALDEALPIRLHSLANEMFDQIPPVHVSFSALEQKLAARGYVAKRRKKLPRTYASLRELAESKEQFRARRFAWWHAKLSSIGMPAQPWKVIRKAGIRKEFVGQVLPSPSVR